MGQYQILLMPGAAAAHSEAWPPGVRLDDRVVPVTRTDSDSESGGGHGASGQTKHGVSSVPVPRICAE